MKRSILSRKERFEVSAKEYYIKKLVHQDIEVEYRSEDNTITLRVERKSHKGELIGHYYLTIPPSYIEPIYRLLTEVAPSITDRKDVNK